MKKSKKNKTNILSLKPDEVDAIIMARIHSFSNSKLTLPGVPKTASKWTEDEKELRDSVILAYMTEHGLSQYRTAQQLAERWQLSVAQAREYVRIAIKNLNERYKDTNEELYNVWKEKLENIVAEALESGSRDAALKALDMLGKSLGFYQKDLTVTQEDNAIQFKFS